MMLTMLLLAFSLIDGPACPDGCATLQGASAGICELTLNLVELPAWSIMSGRLTGPVTPTDVDGDLYELCVNDPDACYSLCESNPGIGPIFNILEVYGDCDADCDVDLEDFAIYQRRTAANP